MTETKPTGLDYLMEQLEKDIKFANKMYKKYKRLCTKHSDSTLCETSMKHHIKLHANLRGAYDEIKRLHDIARCEGQEGDWTGDWTH